MAVSPSFDRIVEKVRPRWLTRSFGALLTLANEVSVLNFEIYIPCYVSLCQSNIPCASLRETLSLRQEILNADQLTETVSHKSTFFGETWHSSQREHQMVMSSCAETG